MKYVKLRDQIHKPSSPLEQHLQSDCSSYLVLHHLIAAGRCERLIAYLDTSHHLCFTVSDQLNVSPVTVSQRPPANQKAPKAPVAV